MRCSRVSTPQWKSLRTQTCQVAPSRYTWKSISISISLVDHSVTVDRGVWNWSYRFIHCRVSRRLPTINTLTGFLKKIWHCIQVWGSYFPENVLDREGTTARFKALGRKLRTVRPALQKQVSRGSGGSPAWRFMLSCLSAGGVRGDSGWEEEGVRSGACQQILQPKGGCSFFCFPPEKNHPSTPACSQARHYCLISSWNIDLISCSMTWSLFSSCVSVAVSLSFVFARVWTRSKGSFSTLLIQLPLPSGLNHRAHLCLFVFSTAVRGPRAWGGGGHVGSVCRQAPAGSLQGALQGLYQVSSRGSSTCVTGGQLSVSVAPPTFFSVCGCLSDRWVRVHDELVVPFLGIRSLIIWGTCLT